MDAQFLRTIQQENARLKEEVSRLRDYMSNLQSLNRAAHHLLSEKDIMTLLDKTLYYALTVLDSQDGALLLKDDDTNELVFVLVQGRVREKLPGYRIPWCEGIAGWVAEHREPAVANNARGDPRFSHQVDQSFDFETRKLVCVPLIARGKVLGVIEVLNKSGGQDFAEADVDLLSLLAVIAAIVLDDLSHMPETESATAQLAA
jgi:NtrC-family two-component system sensor histidine kinase KinB